MRNKDGCDAQGNPIKPIEVSVKGIICYPSTLAKVANDGYELCL